MSRVKRIISSVVAATVLAVSLTGCLSVDAKFKVGEEKVQVSLENKINKQMLLALDKNISEKDLKAFVESNLPTGEGKNKFEVTENDEYVFFSLEDTVTYDEEGLKLVDGAILNTIPFEAKKDGRTSEIVIDVVELTGQLDEETFDTMYESFNVNVQFLGEVTGVSHKGKIKDNTVTWSMKQIKEAVAEGENLKATGTTTPAFPIIPLVIGVVSVLTLAGLGFLIIKIIRKRSRAISNLPNPDIWIPSESDNEYKNSVVAESGYMSNLEFKPEDKDEKDPGNPPVRPIAPR